VVVITDLLVVERFTFDCIYPAAPCVSLLRLARRGSSWKCVASLSAWKETVEKHGLSIFLWCLFSLEEEAM